MRLHDRFTLVARIGTGGMSEVWRATDELLGRPVAVKVLAMPEATDTRLRETIWREARAAARLSHPNVTQVHDYGEVRLAGGQFAGYLVMELVDGQTLAARLAAGPLPWPQTVQVGRQVAAALAAAHRIGVVHRDIKPGNVMLTADGAKVLDFGIAALAGPGDDPGRLLGTPGYAAPERRNTTAPAQSGSDIYSLGVLLWEALTGRRPDQAGAVPDLPDLPGVPEPVSELCRACLAADPVDRPAAASLAAALADVAADGDRPVLAGSGPAAAPEPHPTRFDPQPGAASRRRWPRLAGVAAALVLLGVGAVLLVAVLRSDDPAAPEAESAANPSQPATGPAAAPTTAAAAAPTTPAPQSQSPEQVVGAVERALLDALEQDAITRDAYENLRDEVDDLRDALDEDDPAERDEELRDEAEDLRGEIVDRHADGELDDATAERLLSLLEPLLRR